jgi:hypothetical protein
VFEPRGPGETQAMTGYMELQSSARFHGNRDLNREHIVLAPFPAGPPAFVSVAGLMEIGPVPAAAAHPRRAKS